VGKPEGKRQLGKSMRGWKNITMYIQEEALGVMEGVDMA